MLLRSTARVLDWIDSLIPECKDVEGFSALCLHLTIASPWTGAALLAHPGEDASGDIIVVSAPRCTLLRAAEELGLCKTYRSGDMEAFSYNDRDNFKDSGGGAHFTRLNTTLGSTL